MKTGSTAARVSVSETEPVRLGKYPYPYQAAFTVASDIDSASLARFQAVHALFCGQETIRPHTADWQTLGVDTDCPALSHDHAGVCGLGLDFADSFFLVGDGTSFGMYRHCAEGNRFQEDQQDGKGCGALIWQWLKEGRMDSFHSFLHYTRQQLAPLLHEFYERCEREGVSKPRVWLNHSLPVTPTGLCPANLQPSPLPRLLRLSARKLVGPLLGRARFPLRYAFARYQGDTPGSAYYVNDLLAANGLRYVWLNMGDLHRNQIALPERELNGRRTILEPVTMDDGVRYYRFERCYGKPAGRLGGEAYLRDSEAGFDATVLVTAANLETLCQTEGTMFSCTSIGPIRVLSRSPTPQLRGLNCSGAGETQGRSGSLPRRNCSKWTRRRTFLRVVSRREGKRLLVELEGIDDPLFGREQVSLSDLDGLCLLLPAANREITIAVRGAALDANHFHRSGDLCWLDAQGGLSLRLPIQPQMDSDKHR